MAKKESGAERDAIEMLMEDHRRVEQLFKDFESADGDDADAVREIVDTACMELQVHSLLEEELFYPAVRNETKNEQCERLLNEAEVEHEAVDEFISKLQELEPDDEMYSAYFKVLSEYVKHHVREEETKLMPEAKKLKGLDLAQLAEDMRLRREELFAEIESGEVEGDTEATLEQSEGAEAAAAEEELEDEQEGLEPNRLRH